MLHVTVGPAHQEKLKLEEQRRSAEEKYKYKKRQIRELQEDIEVNVSSDVIIHQTESIMLCNAKFVLSLVYLCYWVIKNNVWQRHSQQVKQVSAKLPYESENLKVN